MVAGLRPLAVGVTVGVVLALAFIAMRLPAGTFDVGDGPLGAQPAQATAATSPADASLGLGSVSLHDLRTMVEAGALSFEAFKAEVLRRMARITSLPSLRQLARQLESVLAELQSLEEASEDLQHRRVVTTPGMRDPAVGLPAPGGSGTGSHGAARSSAAHDAARDAGEGTSTSPRPPLKPGREAGAHTREAQGTVGVSESESESGSDGVGAVEGETPVDGAPAISPALLSAIRRARTRPESEPFNITRLIPTLIFIGNPKCGSTFLWDCMRSGIFDPSNVCGSDSSKWRTCRRRYMMTAFGPRKEFNFYDKHFYKGHGWEWYVGPEVPIHAWERTGAPWTLNAPRRLDHHNRKGSFTETCRRPLEIASEKKPVCKKPSERWRCAFSEACVPIGRAPHLNVRSVLLDHAFPRRADVSEFAVSADPSINYFIKAGPDAMRWMYEAAVDPVAIRFILLMRDPVERTYSNWLMFRQWNWEDVANFTQAVVEELTALERCDPDTFAQPYERLKGMGADDLNRYHTKCIIGPPKHLLNHIRGSIYAIGALQWLRWFSPAQFLVLDNAEVRTLKAEVLLSRIAAHTGLHLELSKVGNFRTECEGLQHHGDARKRYHKHTYAPAAGRLLRNFFRPYNQLLYEKMPQLTTRWPDNDAEATEPG